MRNTIAMAAMVSLWAGCGGERDDANSGFTTQAGPSLPGPSDDPDDDDEATGTGSDDDEATTGPDDEPDADTGDAPPPGGDSSSEPPPNDSGGNDPSPADECHAQATNACENCACDNCLTQLQACEADIGCVAIRICAQAHMCTGLDCLGPCGEVINNNGGAFGEPAGLATAVSDCVEAASCGC